MIPVVFHGSARGDNYDGSHAALQLTQLIDRAGRPRFATKEELCAHFRLSLSTSLIVTGTDTDSQIERWWKLGREGRVQTIAHLRHLGISLVTTPNFSVLTDVPRWGDLHSIARIAETFLEFTSGGVPCALHINSRTSRDFDRWIQFLLEHDEVTHLAYEFSTGAGWSGRRDFHLKQLKRVAEAVGRPLCLIVRGGIDSLPYLSKAFDAVTYLDTSPLLKAQKRMKACRVGNSGVGWHPVRTPLNGLLDELFANNCTIRSEQIRMLCATEVLLAAE
jgi:hypothetical protein